jgi:hypothetical protein
VVAGVLVASVREAQYRCPDKLLESNPWHELAPTGQRHDRDDALSDEVVGLGPRNAQQFGDFADGVGKGLHGNRDLLGLVPVGNQRSWIGSVRLDLPANLPANLPADLPAPGISSLLSREAPMPMSAERRDREREVGIGPSGLWD